MSDSPGQTRPNKVARSNSNPRRLPQGVNSGHGLLTKHQSFIASPKPTRKLPQQASRTQLDDTTTHDNTLIRYMDADMFRTLTGQNNLKLITKLDLSCPPNRPNSRKFPYIDQTEQLTNLVEINLSGNVLSRCDRLAKLTQLQKVYVSHNKLENLDGLWPLINLTVLDVSYNQIQRVPSYLPKKLTALRELYLAGNKLVSLPDIIKLRALTGLVHLSVEDNPLSRLPHCRGMVVYGIPTLELLDGDPISEEEKTEAGTKYARETLEVHEGELNQLRERVGVLEQEVDEAMKGREKLEKSDTHNREELQVRTQENTRLSDQLAVQRRLVDQKTDEMNHVLRSRLELENQLAFYKLDYKVDHSQYTDLFQANFAPDSENSDLEEIPYLGQARFKPSTSVHRTNHPDLSQPASYQAMPGVQYGKEGTIHSVDPSDPAYLARLVHSKEQGIQVSRQKEQDLSDNIDRSTQGIQACSDAGERTPPRGQDNDLLTQRLADVKEELRALKRRHLEQMNSLEDSDEETASMVRESVLDNATGHEMSEIADLIAEKELTMREIDLKLGRSVSVGEQVELMEQESAVLNEQLARERGEREKLTAEKAQLVDKLNYVLNIQTEAAMVQTADDSHELEELRERLKEQEAEIQAMVEDQRNLAQERNGLWRMLHKETAEVGVSVRCHHMDQSTNTPRPQATLALSAGSRVDIPSGEQLWEREKQALLEKLKLLEQDLKEKRLEKRVLEDAISSIDLEKTRAIEERDLADEDRYQARSALLDAETQLEALRRDHAIALDALEGLDNLERDREALEGRLREEEQDRQRLGADNNRLKEKIAKLKQTVTQMENAKQNAGTHAERLEAALRNMETQVRGYEEEIRELRDYIAQVEQDRNRPVLTQATQTPPGPNFSVVTEQLTDLIGSVPAYGEPDNVAEAIRQLPRPTGVQHPEERMVGELSDQLTGLLGHIGEELDRLRDQLVEIEAENADLKEIVNKTHLTTRHTQTEPDPQAAQLEDQLSHLQELLERAEHEMESLRRKRGVEVSTQVKPRLNNQLSQANLVDLNLARENEELAHRLNELESDKQQLLDELDQMNLGIQARDDQLQSQEDDMQQLIAENEELKRELHTIGVQTNGQTMDGDVLTRFRDQAVSPRDNYQELATLGNDMAQLHGRLNQLERQKSYDNNSNMTESIEINGLPTRPPHRNVSLQAGFGDTESREMQTGRLSPPEHFPFKDSSGTQTQGERNYLHSLPLVDSPLSGSSVFSRRERPPNRTEIRLPDRESLQVNSKSTTTTRKPGGTGRRQEFRDIFIDEEIISSYSESEESSLRPNPPPEKTTRVHYRTTRGAQTEKPKQPKASISRSDTELHDKIYISRKKRKHRVKKSRTKHPVNRSSTQRTIVVLSDTGSETESTHSVVEHDEGVDYIYLPKQSQSKHTRSSRPPAKTDYKIHVHKSRAPVEHTTHYHTVDNGEYFCNIPEHVAMEEEIDRLEALLGISQRRNRSTHVEFSVRHNVLDRLSDIERLLKEKVDNLGAKQEEQERLNNQLSREQQHLSRTAAELSRAGDELQQINVHLRGRSQRTDVITGQTSHGGMTPQLDTLQRRIENLTGLLQGTESTLGGEDVSDLSKKSRIQRELNKLELALEEARCCLRDVNLQKRNAQTELYECLDEKAELEDEINRLKITRRTEQANLSYTRSLLRDLKSKQNQFTRAPHQRGVEEERGSKKELEQLKNNLRRYKTRVADLEEALQGADEQNQDYLQEILDLRERLSRIQGKQDLLHKHYNTKHTQTIENLLQNLQSQLSHLQDNIATELYNDEENLNNQVSRNQPSLLEESYPPISESLPDMSKLRLKNHQVVLDNINREHEVLMQYIQGNMQEGEKTVLTAQQETMQGVYDLKKQIEQLQSVIDEHKVVEPPHIPYDMEMQIKMQSDKIEHMDKKLNKMSDRAHRQKRTLSPSLPLGNPFLPSSPSCPLTSLELNQGSYGYNSFQFDTPSKDNPDNYYLSAPNETTLSRNSYHSALDKNLPITPLAPPDSILFEDPPSDFSPQDLRTSRSYEKGREYPPPPHRHSSPRPDETYTHCESSNSARSSHSTASILRHQMPDEHKLKLLEHRVPREYTHPNY